MDGPEPAEEAFGAEDGGGYDSEAFDALDGEGSDEEEVEESLYALLGVGPDAAAEDIRARCARRGRMRAREPAARGGGEMRPAEAPRARQTRSLQLFLVQISTLAPAAFLSLVPSRRILVSDRRRRRLVAVIDGCMPRPSHEPQPRPWRRDHATFAAAENASDCLLFCVQV